MNGRNLRASLKTNLHEVTRAYLSSGKKYPAAIDKKLRENNYKTSYKLYNIDRPKLAKNLASLSIHQLPLEQQAKVWSHIFLNTDYMGIGHLAIDFFKSMQHKKSMRLMIYWPLLKTWAYKIENWAHGDMLASLYCHLLAEEPESILPTLKKWNKHKSPWMKRMSIVSLLYYYHPKRFTPDFVTCASFIDSHLEIDHYYLQKAIGWNLRELSQAHPEKAYNYMLQNFDKISSIAFSASIEKLPLTQKNTLKILRKKNRAKKIKK